MHVTRWYVVSTHFPQIPGVPMVTYPLGYCLTLGHRPPEEEVLIVLPWSSMIPDTKVKSLGMLMESVC